MKPFEYLNIHFFVNVSLLYLSSQEIENNFYFVCSFNLLINSGSLNANLRVCKTKALFRGKGYHSSVSGVTQKQRIVLVYMLCNIDLIFFILLSGRRMLGVDIVKSPRSSHVQSVLGWAGEVPATLKSSHKQPVCWVLYMYQLYWVIYPQALS